MDLEGRHPATRQIARYFAYDHLPTHLLEISAPCAYLAEAMIGALPDGPELTTGLRKRLPHEAVLGLQELPEPDPAQTT